MINLRKKHQLTGHNAGIYALVPGSGPGTFLSAAGDGWIVEWSLEDPENGRLLARVDTQVFSLCYLPEARVIIAGDMNGGVHWINLEEDRPNRHIAHHTKGVFAVEAIGEHILTIGGDGVLTRWAPDEQRSMESLQVSASALRALAYSPERDELAVGSSDNGIYLLDRNDLTIKQHIAGAHDNSVFSLCYQAEGSLLFSGGRDAHLKVWSMEEEPRLLSDQPAHWFTINALVGGPAGTWLFSGSRDKTIKVWNAQSFALVKVLDTARDGGHINSVNDLLWLPQTNFLLSCSDDRSIIIWEVYP